jgi:hypothetical protein
MLPPAWVDAVESVERDFANIDAQLAALKVGEATHAVRRRKHTESTSGTSGTGAGSAECR